MSKHSNERASGSTELKRGRRGKPLHECDSCKKMFTNKSHFECHIRTHTGDKPYECEVCKKKFAQSVNLVTHTRTHTGGKPYEGDVCTIVLSKLRNDRFLGGLSVTVLSITKDIFVDLV
jgi:hypothetical protein